MSDFTDWVARSAEPLRAAQPEPAFLDPETLMAVGAYVQREYGYTGYRVRVLCGDRSGALAEVWHSDGSSFRLWADRYGNVATVPEPAAA